MVLRSEGLLYALFTTKLNNHGYLHRRCSVALIFSSSPSRLYTTLSYAALSNAAEKSFLSTASLMAAAASMPLYSALPMPSPLNGSIRQAASPVSIKLSPDKGCRSIASGNPHPCILSVRVAFANRGAIAGLFFIA